MEMDVGDAELVEELAEIAAAFLEELGAERLLVVHGDEEHATPVTQVFLGLSYDGIESLIFEWNPLIEESRSVLLAERFGRHILAVALRDASGDCLGMLYADSCKEFPDDAATSLEKFARHYLNLLLEICTLQAGAWNPAPINEEAVPQEGIETDESWIDESWADEEEDPSYTQSAEVVDTLPDLQDYIMLDWYR